jgi:hypothetical protein
LAFRVVLGYPLFRCFRRLSGPDHLPERTDFNSVERPRSHRESVKPEAEANTRTLSTGSSVYSKELIHTGDIGVANLRFHDNSNLNVGPKSSVRLDKFVYESNKSAGSVAVEAARGSFRFATGAQSKGSYQVKTPYGTLGIRG